MSLPTQEPQSSTKKELKSTAKDDKEKSNRVANKAAKRAGKTEHAYDSNNDIFTK